GGAAAPGEPAEPDRHARAVAVHHGDVLGFHRQLLGDDLRQGGLDTLPHRSDAGVDRHAARAVDLDARVFPRAEARLLQHAPEADSEIAASRTRLLLLSAQRRVVSGLQRLLARRTIIAAVVDRPLPQRGAADLVRHLARFDEVAAADVGRIEAELARHAIDQPLAHERALVAPGPAIRPGRRLVGHHTRGLALVVLDAIGPGQERDRPLGDDHAVRAGGGAGVGEEAVAQRDDRAVAAHADLDVVILLP